VNVGVRELRLHLSTYLNRTRHGETVIVTDRGRAIARLEPLEPGGSQAPPEAVLPLLDAGVLTYRPPPRRLPAPIPLPSRGKTLAEYVADQRR
jgi:prevent-host-death family protein